MKNNIIILSNNASKSIEAHLSNTNVIIFDSLLKFEEFTDSTPIIVSSVFVFDDVVKFSNTALSRLDKALSSHFIKINEKVYYISTEINEFSSIEELIKRSFDWVPIKGRNDLAFITDLITGRNIKSVKETTEVTTYRVSKSEVALKQQQIREELKNKVIDNTSSIAKEHTVIPENTDNIMEDLSGIAENEELIKELALYGYRDQARQIAALAIARQLSMRGKTVIIDDDIKYHSLSELIKRFDAPVEFIEISEVRANIHSIANRVHLSQMPLIVIGSTRKINYDYELLYNLLKTALKKQIMYIVKLKSLSSIPPKGKVIAMTSAFLPDTLKQIEEASLVKEDIKDVTWIALDLTYGYYSLTPKEFNRVLQVLTGNENVKTDVVNIAELTGANATVIDMEGVLACI